MEQNWFPVKTQSGNEIELNFDVLLKALGVLLKLAPQELRSPPDFLDACYRQKIGLQEAFGKIESGESDNPVDIMSDEYKTAGDACKNCYASPETCKIRETDSVGNEECIKRRERYADENCEGDVSEGGGSRRNHVDAETA